jgi:putative DNA primase/helicase
MTAAEIARRLGGRQTGRGRWICRCPAHDDRTPSLSLRDGQHGLLVHCFAGCRPRDVLTALLSEGFDGDPRPGDRGNDDEERQAAERRNAAAQRIWQDARAVAPRGPVALYLAGRGIVLTPPAALRWSPRCWDAEPKAYSPAMIAAVRNVDGELVAVHRTYLARDAGGRWRRRHRMALGPIGAGAVRLAPPAGDAELVVAEGIETTLAVMQATGLPGWAALSAGGIERLALPPEATRVLTIADHDRSGVGERAARRAADRWVREGRTVRIALPPRMGDDAADILSRGAI